MITPWEILMDPVSIAILAMYALLMIWEAVFPAQELPKVKFWKLRGMAAFAFFFFLSSYLPLFIDPYLEPYRLFDLTNLTTVIGGLVGVCLYEFGVYVWHRAMHNSDFLWRTFHQMHHSAERLDTYGAFYFSPMDMIGWTVLGSICFALLVGLSPQAITVTLLVTNFMGMFQHANIKTAPWLGYIIQRPESHTVHHAQGIHKYNYSDLPIFDILFGTFKNPENYEYRTGLFHGASAKVLDMLCFKDLIKERQKKKAKKMAAKSINKALALLLLMSLSIGCSKDDGISVTEPVVEAPSPVEPVAKPKLGEVSPLFGPKGTMVDIQGENFGDDESEVSVFFNDMKAEGVFLTDNFIEVPVPPRAYSGNIKVELKDTVLVGPMFEYILSDTIVNTLAGSQGGNADGLGAAGKFFQPTGIALDAEGNAYVADQGNHRIRKITPDGEVTTYAGGEQGALDGPALEAKFNAPWDVDVDAAGNVYVADSQNNRIRKISPDGVVITLAGSQPGDLDGEGMDAQFNNPMGVAVTPDGIVYVADSNNKHIRKIDREGKVTTFPGAYGAVTGIATDTDGFVYIVTFNTHSVWKIDFDNAESELMAGNNGEGDIDGTIGTAFSFPKDVAVDAQGNLYVTDDGNNKIRMINTEGRVSTYAGGNFGSKDGPVATAELKHPFGLTVSPEGIVYVADSGNHRIRTITQE
nr:sterol desaturase family protein [Allomuricauda sp.]